MCVLQADGLICIHSAQLFKLQQREHTFLMSFYTSAAPPAGVLCPGRTDGQNRLRGRSVSNKSRERVDFFKVGYEFKTGEEKNKKKREKKS